MSKFGLYIFIVLTIGVIQAQTGGGGSGQPCPQGCSMCGGGTCSSASSGYYLSSSKLLQCPTTCPYCYGPTCSSCADGYYSLNGVCYQCRKGCGCTSSTPAQCTSCLDGYFSDGNGGCDSCAEGCRSCTSSSSTACASCFDGYSSSIVMGSCTKCSLGCSDCYGTMDSQCSRCLTGYYLDYARCIKCSTGCSSCTNGTSCSVCSPGYYLPQNGTTCSKCTATDCTCGYEAPAACSGCPSGYYFDGSICRKCNGLCTSCTSAGDCKGCQPGLYLNVYGSCDNCNTAGCLCDSSNPSGCNGCVSGYYVNGATCTQCSATGCSECKDSTTCTACKVGYFLADSTDDPDIDADDCLACNSNCRTCSGTSTTCTSCKIGSYLNGSTCATCPTGCYECSDVNTCTLCSSDYYKSGNSCLSCSLGPCSSCTGFPLVCNQCQDGYYLQDGTCKSCTQSPCTGCNGSSGCNACVDGFYPESGICKKCLGICSKCNGATGCTECKEGYYLVGSTCVQCPNDGCQCNALSPDSCSSCIAGKYSMGGLCYDCMLSDCVCNNSGSGCTGCKDGYYGTSSCSQCTKPGCICSNSDPNSCSGCLPGYFYSSSACTQCSSNCSACTGTGSSQCLGCNKGYYLSSGSCLACSLTNCTACTDSTTCIKCSYGYYLRNGSCLACTGGPCTQCSSGTPAQCSQCANGYYLNNGTCLSCPATCSTCTGASTCTVCQTGHYLNNGSCLACNASPCTQCNGSTPAQCSQCEAGYYLSNGTCLQCDSSCKTCQGSATTCASCADGKYLGDSIDDSDTDNDDCLACPATCSTCTDASTCTVCQTGHYLNNGSCLACTGGPCTQCGGSPLQCSQCADGYYLDNGTCLQCDSSCKTCQGSGNTCTSCADGKYLGDGDTTDLDYALDECLPCPTVCKTCSGSGTCTSCIDGYYQHSPGSTCHHCPIQGTKCDSTGAYTTCLNGYYGTAPNCSQCTAGCACTTSGGCDSCIDNYYQDGSNCSQCTTGCTCTTSYGCDLCSLGYSFNYMSGTCDSCDLNCSGCSTSCIACNRGYYLDNSSNCSQCPSACSACENATKCTVCQTGHYLNNGSCLACTGGPCTQCSGSPLQCSQCADGYYLDNGTCLQCHSSCKTCQGSSTTCRSCVDGKYLGDSTDDSDTDNDDCLACPATCSTCSDASTCTGCKTGYYLDSGSCSKCVDGCSTCSNASSNTCSACLEGAGNDESNCDCTFGYYVLVTDSFRTCPKCNLALCDDCEDGSACTKCVPNAILSSGTCSCDSGYVSIDNKYCRKCPYLCETCNASGVCSDCFDNAGDDTQECDCIKGYYYKNGRCNQCPLLCGTCGPEGCTTPKNNASCDADGTSCTCNAGYYESSGSCSACQDLCNSCTSSGCQSGGCVANAVYNSGTQECSCAPKYYKNGNQCDSCGSLCKRCSGTGANPCLECVSNAAIFDGSCKCTKGYYKNDNNECVQCPDLCEDCTETGCSSCKPNAKVDNGDCECIDGYYESANTCTQCTNPLCKACDSSGGNCTECLPNAGSNTANCQCATGYYQENSRCVRCPDLAASCTSGSITNCVSNATASGFSCACDSGYYFWNRECKKCPNELCGVCTFGVCTACKASANPISNGVCTCLSGTKYKSSDDTCESCEDLCGVCSHTGCDSCKTNASKLNGNGVCTCDQGYYKNGTTCSACSNLCQTCDPSSGCTQCKANAGTAPNCACIANYILQGDECVADCGSNCKTCTPPNGCTACNDGFYLNSSTPPTCQPCIDNCKTCSTNSGCTLCSDNFYYKDSACVGVPVGCTRVIGNHASIVPEANHYIKDPTGTVTCPTIPDNCKLTTDGSFGITAKDGYYFDSSSTGSTPCIKCNPACATCSGSANACNSDCVEHAEYDVNDGCVCSKSYLINATTVPGVCVYQCPTGCATCDDSGHKCLTCSASYVFWPDVEGCYIDCPTGYTKSTINGREKCNPTSTNIFEALLTEDKTLTKNNNGLTLTGTNVVPAYQRGWYFKAQQDSNAILSSNIVYGVNFSIQFWIYFDSIADYSILKKVGTPETMKIYIDTGVLKLSSYVESYDKHFEKSAKIVNLATSLTANTWYLINISYTFTAGTTSINPSINGVAASTLTLSNSLVYDLKSNLVLGSDSASSNYFSGFISYFITANTATLTPTLELPATLPTCLFTQTQVPTGCGNCESGCSIGCTIPGTCPSSIDGVCTDILCESCPTKFKVCDTCKALSIKNATTGQCGCVVNSTFDVTTRACKCNFGYAATTSNDKCIVSRDFLTQADISRAEYDNLYTKITIYLNTAIQRNQFTSCESLFIPESYILIGSNSDCTLKDVTNNEIYVTLRDKSTFTIGDLKLNTMVLIGNRTNRSTDLTPLTISVSLVNGSDPLLTAVITGPSIYSLSCNLNSLFLKGDDSSYLKRFGISYAWSVSGDATVVLSEVITGTSSTLSIPPNKLKAGSLTVNLIITNTLSQINSVSKTITLVGSPYLSVTKAASFNLNQKRDSQIVISIDVGNRCNLAVTPTYAWSFVSTTSGSFVPSTLDNIAKINPTYTIPANTLEGPYTYTFNVVVTETLSATLSFTGQTDIVLNVSNEDLIGSLNFVNGEENGIFSIQEDLSIVLTFTNLHGFTPTYTWVCDKEGGIADDCSEDTSVAANSFRIPVADLEPHIKYTITVTATTPSLDNRTFSKTISIRGINSNPSATLLDGPVKPSANQDLVFFPAIETVNAATFTWKNVIQGAVWNDGSTTYQNLDFPLLIIPDISLNPSTEYHFELEVTENSAITYKTFLFTTNSPPQCGALSTTFTNTGRPLIDSFTFSVNGCNDDEDSDLSYTFSITFVVGSNPGSTYVVKSGSKQSSYTTKLNSYAKSWKVKVCDLKQDCYESASQPITLATRRRMLSSEILDAFMTMTEDSENIPAATIMALMSDTLDRDTYNTIKLTFDEYVKSVSYTKYTRDLVVSVYKAIIEYQAEILSNREILEMIELCYEMVVQNGPINKKEALEIFELFYKVIVSRSDDQFFVAQSLGLLEKIFISTLDNSLPRSLANVNVYEDFYYERLFGNTLKGLSVPLDSMNVTLPSEFESYGEYKMYDFFIKAFKTEGLPIFMTYLAEVGYYERPNIVYYDTRSPFNETDNLILQFEVPYNSSNNDLSVKCQIFSEDTGLWIDTSCTGKISDSKVKFTTSNFGIMRLIAEEQTSVDESSDECEMNPAAYAIVCFWFSLTILATIINFLRSSKQSQSQPQPQFYSVVGSGILQGSKVLNNYEMSELSPRSQPDDISVTHSNFLSKFILLRIFNSSERIEKAYSILSLLTATFFGFAVLGAFTYHFGDVNDNSEVSLSDIAEDYYPEDIKMVFIALTLVIPAVLPIRLISKFTGAFRPLTLAFTIMILIGSLVGVLAMGAMFCQGAMMRWTLSYLIYTPLELAISELILAAVVHFAGGN